MLSGLRVVPRDQIASNLKQKGVNTGAEDLQRSKRHRKEGKEKAKSKTKRRSHHLQTSSDRDDGRVNVHRRYKGDKSRKHKRGHSSDSFVDEDNDTGSSERENIRTHKQDRSGRKKRRVRYSDPSSGTDPESGELGSQQSDVSEGEFDEGAHAHIKHHANAARKEAGLEWMTKAPHHPAPIAKAGDTSASVSVEEKLQENPKELNPYLKDGGDGYPSEKGGLQNMGGSSLSRPPVVGDGGLSWRLKALKRAKEHAEREGRKLDEVVEERWGSLAEMTVSVSARRAAHSNAHLHAIRDRKRNAGNRRLEAEKESCEDSAKGGNRFEQAAQLDEDSQRIRSNNREYLKDVNVRDNRMKVPQLNESLSWKRNKSGLGRSMRAEDAEIVQAAASALNKFEGDGSFLRMFKEKHAQHTAPDREGNELATNVYKNDTSHVERSKSHENLTEHEIPVSQMCEARGSMASSVEMAHQQLRALCKAGNEQTERMDNLNATRPSSMHNISIEEMSANQLAAKAMQLRLRGKNQDADELLKQLQILKQVKASIEEPSEEQLESGSTRPIRHETQKFGPSLKSITADHKHRIKKDDGDTQMAESILHNKKYNLSTRIDDEYDFGTGLEDSEYKRKKSSKNLGGKEAIQAMHGHKRIITQQERCQFCFDNPSRPKHLTISIANSTYLMLPPREPLLEGHCYIVPMQHEGSSRNVDENVWEELRNYKKCLLRMFADQDKDVVFMETAIALAQQRRHCLVECIPLPRQVAKDAPLYFKKAIDEAEEEWSQHNAKKLIDTSTKGLRGCIPKNFPYFHVEFGLDAGYVHVIDDEKNFNSHLGRDVVVGMLQLPEEEMYRRRRHESYEQQRKAVSEFQKTWDPFDWTKMLD